MLEQQRDMRVPTELLPKCPVCGAPMAMNLRCDSTFVQDAGWYAAADRYKAFLSRQSHTRMLFLELGVGGNTPAIIKCVHQPRGERLPAGDPQPVDLHRWGLA